MGEVRGVSCRGSSYVVVPSSSPPACWPLPGLYQVNWAEDLNGIQFLLSSTKLLCHGASLDFGNLVFYYGKRFQAHLVCHLTHFFLSDFDSFQ